MLIQALLVTLVLASQAQAQARFSPKADEVVLPRSVYVQDAASQALKKLARAWREQPTRSETALAYARAAFEQGLKTGDLRWYGNAKSALMPWWQAQAMSAEGFYLRGLVKQGFHDFQSALDDINQAIAQDPHQAEFWSWRFTLNLLRTQLPQAQADLRQMERVLGKDEASIYQAVYDYRTGRVTQALETLEKALRKPQFQDATSQEWVGFHWGEALRLSGQAEQAIAAWKTQLDAQPQSHWLRLAMATQLNAMGRHRQAYEVAVHGKPIELLSDALLAQGLLAAQHVDQGLAQIARAVMASRQQAQALRQDDMIERPSLVYLIESGADPAQGLALSIQNWKAQQDPPDAILFAKAALLAQKPHAALPVVQWVRQTGYTDPQLNRLLQALQAHPNWQNQP